MNGRWISMCRMLNEILHAQKEAFPNKVRFVFVHLHVRLNYRGENSFFMNPINLCKSTCFCSSTLPNTIKSSLLANAALDLL